MAESLKHAGLLTEEDFEVLKMESFPSVLQQGPNLDEMGKKEDDDAISSNPPFSSKYLPENSAPPVSAEEEVRRNDLLKEAICTGFFMNVCVVNGNMRAGYKVGRLPDRSAVIHPSSTLALLKAEPKCLIYHELVKTSKFFIRDLTVVDPDLIVKISPRFSERIRLRQLIQKKFLCFEVENVGPALRRAIVGKRGLVLQELETSLCATIEVSHLSSTVRLFAVSDLFKAAKEGFLRFLDHQRDKLREETTEIALFNTDTRAVMGLGCTVSQILLKGQHRKVIIRGFPLEFRWLELESKLRVVESCRLPENAILDMKAIGVSSDGKTSSGIIICSLPEYCEAIVHSLDQTSFEGNIVRALATTERSTAVLPFLKDTGIKVVWNIFPPTGNGNIVFDSEGYAELAAGILSHPPLNVRGQNVTCDYSRNARNVNEPFERWFS